MGIDGTTYNGGIYVKINGNVVLEKQYRLYHSDNMIILPYHQFRNGQLMQIGTYSTDERGNKDYNLPDYYFLYKHSPNPPLNVNYSIDKTKDKITVNCTSNPDRDDVSMLAFGVFINDPDRGRLHIYKGSNWINGASMTINDSYTVNFQYRQYFLFYIEKSVTFTFTDKDVIKNMNDNGFDLYCDVGLFYDRDNHLTKLN